MKNLTSVFSLIKVGYNAKKILITLPSNKFILNVLTLLYKEGYIAGFFVLPKINKVQVFLKYFENFSVLKNVLYISKSTNRQYKRNYELRRVFNKGEFFVISSSKGLKTHLDCHSEKVGGELLFLIRIHI